MTVSLFIDERLRWDELGRYRAEAGLRYEKHRWTFPSASPAWSGGLPFEQAQNTVLRDRWIDVDGAVVPASKLVDRAALPVLARGSLSGVEVARVVAALIGEAGGVLISDQAARAAISEDSSDATWPMLARIDSFRACALACDVLADDPAAYLVPAIDHQRPVRGWRIGQAQLRAIRELRDRWFSFAEFATLAGDVGWLMTGVGIPRAVAIYSGGALGTTLRRAAHQAEVTLESDASPEASTQASPLPSFAEVPSSTGVDVDLGGTNVGALPERHAARSLVLDDSAVVDLAPLATWPALERVSLGKLRLASLAAVAKVPALSLAYVDPAALTVITPTVVDLALQSTELADLTPLRGAARLRRLTLRDVPLSSLAGIENLAALEHLEIAGDAAPAHLGFLSQLPALRSLRLGTRTAIDAASLPPLPRLEHLDLSGVDGCAIGLASPAALARFPALRSLSLRTTDVADVAWLSALRALTSVELGATQVADLAPLAALTALERLDVASCPVGDVRALVSLAALRRLDITYVDAADTAVIAGLAALTELTWDGYPRADLLALAPLRRLRVLRAGQSSLAALDGVDRFVHLEHLEIGGSQVTSLAPLSPVTKLRTLFAGAPGLEDVSPLANLPRLAHLRLAGSAVSDLRALATTSALERVSLARLDVDLAPLAGHAGLAELDLDGARLLDAAPLAALTALRDLRLAMSSIATLEPLRGLRQLRVLDVTDLGRDVDLAPLLDLPPLARLVVTDTPALRAHPSLALRHHVTLRQT
jgi:Leucine-rich repeat (LRR) protein